MSGDTRREGSAIRAGSVGRYYSSRAQSECSIVSADSISMGFQSYMSYLNEVEELLENENSITRIWDKFFKNIFHPLKNYQLKKDLLWPWMLLKRIYFCLAMIGAILIFNPITNLILHFVGTIFSLDSLKIHSWNNFSQYVIFCIPCLLCSVLQLISTVSLLMISPVLVMLKLCFRIPITIFKGGFQKIEDNYSLQAFFSMTDSELEVYHGNSGTFNIEIARIKIEKALEKGQSSKQHLRYQEEGVPIPPTRLMAQKIFFTELSERTTEQAEQTRDRPSPSS